jgi:hypothetical protein
MMAEPNVMPRKAREQLVELIFEKYKPPALFLAKNAVGLAFHALNLCCLLAHPAALALHYIQLALGEKPGTPGGRAGLRNECPCTYHEESRKTYVSLYWG